MSDEPLTHTSLSLFGRQVFEYGSEKDENGVSHTVTLPGFYEIYTTVDGVDQVLYRRKAPGLLADIERAKKNRPTPTATPPASQQELAAPEPQPQPPVEQPSPVTEEQPAPSGPQSPSAPQQPTQ